MLVTGKILPIKTGSNYNIADTLLINDFAVKKKYSIPFWTSKSTHPNPFSTPYCYGFVRKYEQKVLCFQSELYFGTGQYTAILYMEQLFKIK